VALGTVLWLRKKETHDMHTFQVINNSLETGCMASNLSFGIPSSALDGKRGIRCNVCLKVDHPIIPVFDGLNFSNCIRLTRKWSIINYKVLDTIPIFNCIYYTDYLNRKRKISCEDREHLSDKPKTLLH